MHIGVDATCWHNQRGYGRHARALFSHLLRLDAENRFDFLVDLTEGLEELPENAHWRYVSTKVASVRAARAEGSRSLADLWRMSTAFSASRYQLLIFPTVYTYVPVRTRAKKILFIHDVIPETYPGMTLPNPRSRWLWQAKTRLAIRQADILLTVSDYSREGIARHFQIDSQKIGVVGEAPDVIFKPLHDSSIPPDLEALGVAGDRRLIVYVGGFGPHKNVHSMLQAVQELLSDPAFSDVQIVLVGENQADAFYSEFATLNQFVEQHLAGQAVFTGYLADDLLVRLLNCARVLVLPSWMEGFGLPAIEAAACGCPVIATRASPLPEILGKSALYITPGEVRELVSHLKTVLSSQEISQCMRQGGIKAVQSMSWDSAALQLSQAIQKAVHR